MEGHGPIDPPAAHESIKVEHIAGATRVHVETPPVDPKAVTTDLNGDVVDILVSDSIYTSIDVPYGTDANRMQVVKTRGHLEIVFPE